MILELNGLEVECVIGEREDERNRLQRLLVDLRLVIPDAASETDALEDTIDYAELADAVRERLVAAKCRMIERAARLAAECAMRDPRVKSCEARVTKRGSVEHLASAVAVYSQVRRELI